MFLFIGALVGINLCVRIVLSEARERGLQGRTGAVGASKLRLDDYLSIIWRGALFLGIPIVIGLLLDLALGTTIAEIGAGLGGSNPAQ